MALMDEVKAEILQRREKQVAPTGNNKEGKDSSEKPKRRRRRRPEDMTKEELEEYKRKMMEKEESMYLNSQADQKPRRKRRSKNHDEGSIAKSACGNNGKSVTSSPKILQPLQPLYILKVPGLPKGDALVVCLTHGVE